MLHTFRLLKTAATLSVILILVSLFAGLIYLNQIGFPGQYGQWVRDQLAHRGIHLEFTSLRYSLEKGLVATEVAFFEEAHSEKPLLSAQEVVLDLDRTKALRGIFRLRSIEILNGEAELPVENSDHFVKASTITGTVFLGTPGRLEVREANGIIQGIQVTLTADLKLPDPDEDAPHEPESPNLILSTTLHELTQWQWAPASPPTLSLSLRGDLTKQEKTATSFHFEAQNLTRNHYHIQKLKVDGDLKSNTVTFDQIFVQDASGAARAKADWHLTRGEGRFTLDSTLHFQEFLSSCFQITISDKLILQSSPTVRAAGRVKGLPDGQVSVQAQGEIETEKLQFLETSYHDLTSTFSWSDGDLFLRDLDVAHQGGRVTGDILAKGPLVTFELTSTVPVTAFRPFIRRESHLEKLLKQFTFSPESKVALTTFGTLSRKDLRDWAASGQLQMKNFNYKGTAFHYASLQYQFVPGKMLFSKLRALLDDRSEPARTRFKGQASKEIHADRITYDQLTRFTSIDNLRGQVWPTPVIRAFAPKVAKHILENYRFHETPTLAMQGRFAGKKEEQDQSVFSVAVRTSGQTDYPFLGQDLPLQDLSADLIVEGFQIDIKNLSFQTMSGSATGQVLVKTPPQKKTAYRGSIKFDNLSFPELSQIYQLEEEEKGSLTGSIDFYGQEGDARNFNADGVLGISKGNLVSLPVLGPLSPLIAGVLGDKRMGYERAKEASATFAVRKGILQTKNFVAASRSIILTGEGWINLYTEKIDMIVRVNAKGLLGLLAAPLTPFKGIFQFRGTGNYSEPKWRSSPFTKPPKGEEDPIFQKAGRALIVPE